MSPAPALGSKCAREVHAACLARFFKCVSAVTRHQKIPLVWQADTSRQPVSVRRRRRSIHQNP